MHVPSQDVSIVPRFEIRHLITNAIASVAGMRGQLMALGGNLARTAAMVELGQHQIRAASLGIMPAGIDERMIPTQADVKDLQQLVSAIAVLAKELATVAGLDPFDPAAAG
jgi:hypothetical protein